MVRGMVQGGWYGRQSTPGSAGLSNNSSLLPLPENLANFFNESPEGAVRPCGSVDVHLVNYVLGELNTSNAGSDAGIIDRLDQLLFV